MADIKREDVLTYLETANMLEVSELIKDIEEKFGVTATAPVAVAGGGVWCGVRDHPEKERAGEIFVHLLVPRAGTPKGESPIATAGGAASGPSPSRTAGHSPT